MEQNMADSGKWKFRGEGNAFLVLTNTQEKMVFRLAKSTHWGKGHLCKTGKTTAEKVHTEMGLVVDYMKNVMQPLLSPSFVVLPELRLLDGGILEEAENQIQESRPAQRKGKEVEHSTIDPDMLSALVLPDLCYVQGRGTNLDNTTPTISVEIKPKKAFKHSHDSLNISSEEKSQVCKFCMHQRLKAKEGQWPETSRYCPLDLFSGNRQRMRHALIALAETPQNNLRICQDGEEVHGAWNKFDLSEVLQMFFACSLSTISNGHHSRYKLLPRFLDLVLEALLYVPEDEGGASVDISQPTMCSSPVQYCQNSRPETSNYLSSQDSCTSDRLPAGCVLNRILAVQQLDVLDIDGVYPLYKELEQQPDICSSYHLDGPYNEGDWLEALTHDCGEFIISDATLTAVDKVKRFLVSKTMQDCSIMVALQRINENENEATIGPCLTDSEGQRFRFSVTIIDLDPKPFCKIPAYNRQDVDIVKAYRESGID
ncbi:inositol-pentakisphosphate 2-kinase-like [Mya arenaria]|uniref:inositol-pentakisphosphate 2-kinase-like n=1 Tax=Mya arenaria TaxID=6604 RepID=UPI0022E313E8|nr:inositol-pentakisphosphate 2-kinase-like [Mya arenaria]